MSVYLLTDVGSCSPCNGVIYGIFDTYEAAKKLEDRLNAIGTGKICGWSDNETCIHTLKINHINEYALGLLEKEEQSKLI